MFLHVYFTYSHCLQMVNCTGLMRRTASGVVYPLTVVLLINHRAAVITACCVLALATVQLMLATVTVTRSVGYLFMDTITNLSAYLPDVNLSVLYTVGCEFCSYILL